MNNSTKVTIVVLAVALVLTVGMAYISNIAFKTPNFVSALYGFALVHFSDTEYVEIDHSPLTVITKTSGSIDKYMMENGGYTEVPESQLGALYFYENENYNVCVCLDFQTTINSWIWRIEEPMPKQN